MTFRTLIRRSLRYHWRAHLGVVLGAAVGSAALIGALVVGDSVRESLKQSALQRLGSIHFALGGGDRTFTASLAGRMPRDLMDSWRQDEGDTWVYFNGGPAGALILPGIATASGGTARANRVQVVGVAQSPLSARGNHYHEFWSYADSGSRPVLPRGEALLNQALAVQLDVKVGDSVIIRTFKPAALSREVAVTARGDDSVFLRLRVAGLATPRELGEFSLRATAAPVNNAFVNLAELQEVAQLPGRVNVMVSGGITVDPERTPRRVQGAIRPLLGRKVADKIASWFTWQRQRDSATAVQEFQAALQEAAELADYEATFRGHPSSPVLDLISRRVFLDRPLTDAALSVATESMPLLTYLANLLQAGTNATPYSMVTAAGSPWTPADMRDDEILVNQWLAEDLQTRPGDEIALVYFDPESGGRLIEHTNTFRVHGIVPMEMPWADRTLMPDFPGIEKAESTSDWDAGFPLLYKIRQKDEDYWKQHRGTPKAFVTLAAGQRMWANRFGNLTAIRFPIPTTAPLTQARSRSEGERENRSPASGKLNAENQRHGLGESESDPPPSPLPGEEGEDEGGRQTNFVENYRAALEKKILANLKPEEVGLRFEPVREQALKAAEQSQDFGGLFLGFSFFLIAAALLLMALLFQLGLEQRASEIGTFLALGFTPKQVRRMLIWESAALSLIGGVLGALGGLGYARAMLHGLATIWRDAVGASALSFHAAPQTLVIGVCASTAVCVVTVWLSLRRFVRRPATELLAAEVQSLESGVRSPKSKVVAVGAFMAAVGLAGWTVARGDTANAGAFFGAGALVLIAGLSFVSAWLRGRTSVSPVAGSEGIAGRGSRHAGLTLVSLAVRGCARRCKRSLSTVAMLACGSFLIVSIGVFRLDANRDATKRSSGTGGFAFIGETTMPVMHDLNSSSGRDFFALSDGDLKDVNFVPFRVREGDEASCLNLNRAQKPRLLGVKPQLLEGRFMFAKGSGWWALKSEVRSPKSKTPEIGAIGDANSIRWSMGRKVGDTIDYVDERGQPFKVRIVGAVVNSILQGQLIIDEGEFVRRFPGEAGHRMFLIDAPSNRAAEGSATLSRAMQDVGLELTPAARRLAQFNAVQNTYLGTFQVLGGLGLLLGSAGLGIVVLRNVLERRGELAVLLAMGFRRRALERLVLSEHGALLGLGLGIGLVSAAVAVLPSLLSPGTQLPYGSLAWTLAGVLLNGAVWTWLATRVALRGNLLEALRNE